MIRKSRLEFGFCRRIKDKTYVMLPKQLYHRIGGCTPPTNIVDLCDAPKSSKDYYVMIFVMPRQTNRATHQPSMIV